MSIIRAIVISSLIIPALIFVIFLGVGIVFLVATLIQSGEYNKGWFGIVYAGTAYGYVAVLLSSIPTVVLGLPACLLARKYNYMSRKVILLGAFLLGALFLAVAGAFFFKSYSIQAFAWLFATGGIGGLINGAVFVRQMKPGDSPSLTKERNIQAAQPWE